jgi:MFS family permease
MVADPTAPGYSHTTTIIGAVNGVFFGAGFFGTFLSGWLNDRVGRVNSIRIGSTIGIIGGIIQTAAVNQAMVCFTFPLWFLRPPCGARGGFRKLDTEPV